VTKFVSIRPDPSGFVAEKVFVPNGAIRAIRGQGEFSVRANSRNSRKSCI
jgi:hypothetical protein